MGKELEMDAKKPFPPLAIVWDDNHALTPEELARLPALRLPENITAEQLAQELVPDGLK